jgi:hypothetical protein
MPVVSGFGVIELLAGGNILKDQNIFIFSGTSNQWRNNSRR